MDRWRERVTTKEAPFTSKQWINNWCKLRPITRLLHCPPPVISTWDDKHVKLSNVLYWHYLVCATNAIAVNLSKP